MQSPQRRIVWTRVAALIVGLTIVGVLLPAGPGKAMLPRSAGPRLTSFVGKWWGDDRGLSIGRNSVGTVEFTHVATVEARFSFRISHLSGTAGRPIAQGTVTSAHVYGHGYETPHAGQPVRLSLQRGVVDMSYRIGRYQGGMTYCDARAAATGACGG